MKKLLRLAGLIAVVATIVWLTRERLLPAPRITEEPPPRYRSTPPSPPQTDPDDLEEIKGIGPVFSARLNEAGVSSFDALAASDVETLAAAAGTSPDTAQGWIAQAKARLR